MSSLIETPDTITVQALINLGACDPAIEWAREQGPLATGQDLWDTCTKGNWMLWFLVRVIPGHEAYHRFIRCMTVRALMEAPFLDKFDEDQYVSLREAITAKEYWRLTATQEQLSTRIIWGKEDSWQKAFLTTWDKHNQAKADEIDQWVHDLREFFPIKVSLQEKNGKWTFKASFG